MTYVLVWLFFGVFTALLASSRNRSALGWFFIGFIFGPFGLLFAFFMKDGKDIEAEEKSLSSQKNSNIVLSEDTYHYEIRPKKGVNTADEWHRVKKFFFNLLNGNYRIKQNDNEVVLLEVSKSAYIKMVKIKKNNEKGSLELLFKVDSVKCGEIDFGNDVDVIHSEKEKVTPDDSSTDNLEKLIKLADMLDKRLITENEFKQQKAQLI